MDRNTRKETIIEEINFRFYDAPIIYIN